MPDQHLERTSPVTIDRRQRWPVWMITVVIAATTAACDDLLVSGPMQEAGNVDVVIDAAVVESETGIAVDGRTVINHPNNGRALWLDRFERYDLGGFPELDYPQPARHALSWRILLTHEVREEKGDSTIFRFFDHDEVAVAGVAMQKLTDTPHLGPSAPPIRFDNFIRYMLMTSLDVQPMDGPSSTWIRTPFHDDMVAGHAIGLATTGSDSVLPVEATFAVRPFAVLTGLENAGPLDLEHGGVPVIDVEAPLVFTFDRPLDPERAFIIVHPMHRNMQPGTRAAFIQTRSPSARVVVPPHILRQLAGDETEQPAFRAIVVEVLVDEDVFAGRLADDGVAGDAFSLPFVQRGETSIHLYLAR